ncbi:polar amino acid transport system permease protein [Rhodopseudomonas julia]|uniref:Polar amino acid transport system permease protein n=1 Tax=Rhodopseudomonas julia TaxID=200617 RepID=A0ABU0C8Y6_9BRAD|nr:amino acid ABC transporter permease [Rhodopseudomonas julia]MDQ0326980.1 polar amino acid transport system permease protein [Rhodopseudomonas julia]
MQNLNFQQVLRYREEFIDGLLATLQMTGISAFFGLIIGVVGALLLTRGPKPLRILLKSYIEIIRNTPPLIQLFIIFFIFPSIGVRLSPFPAACVALSIYFGAYAIEIIRSGLNSIPKSQIEAGECLGLTSFEVFRFVILPPALRNIYPSLTSQLVLLLLGTSVASQIAATELFHTATFVESRTFRSFEVYALISAIYVVVVVASRVMFAAIGAFAFRWPVRR